MKLSIEEKRRAYKLAYALEIAETIHNRVEAKTISLADALQMAQQVHSLDWWLWELRHLYMFEDLNQPAAYYLLERLTAGDLDQPCGIEELDAEFIACGLQSWVMQVNNEEHYYGGEVGFVGEVDGADTYVVYTYDPHPSDPLDSAERVIANL